MRLLPFSQQTSVLNAACDFIRFHSNFRVDQTATDWGRCGSNIRIISGEEEGLFGWIAVNYLMDQFTRNDDAQTTYGFLDMGGASTQIAFEPSAEERTKTKNLIDVRLRLIGGEEIHHQVFVTTWLGYGTNQARERYLDQILERYESSLDSGHEDNRHPVPDPCLPRNLLLQENSAYPGHEDSHSRRKHDFIGTGSFEQCLSDVAPLLNKDAPCPDVPCLFNGVHVPQIDFSVSHFIGVSEYWYSSEHVFGLGGAYNFEEFERAASDFCARDWDGILRQHEAAQVDDPDVEHDPEDPRWSSIDESRLQMQCFKSAWLVNVLHEGIGLPRIVDRNGNSDEGSEEVEDMAKEKGLGRPMMQSLDTIGDVAISWTLGKMVLEASREIPPVVKGVPPLPEPLLENPTPLDDPITISRPSDYALTPTSPREYSEMFGTFSYLLGTALLLFILFRLRHLISAFFRPSIRSMRRSRAFVGDEGLSLEDGPGGMRTNPTPTMTSFSSRLWLPVRIYLSRLVSNIQTRTDNSLPKPSPTSRYMHAPPYRNSPPRSYSSPTVWTQSASSGRASQEGIYSTSFAPPRSATPPIYRPDTPQLNGHLGTSLYSLPRSRNNSQMNLTSLVTRQPMSRSGSTGAQTPTNAFHNGD